MCVCVCACVRDALTFGGFAEQDVGILPAGLERTGVDVVLHGQPRCGAALRCGLFAVPSDGPVSRLQARHPPFPCMCARARTPF